MSSLQRTPAGPVTAADVEEAVRLAVTTLRGAEGADWSVRAGSLEWDCWETAEHLADDFFGYAAQLGPARPPAGTHIPFAGTRQRPDGPLNVVFADRAAGPAGLLHVLEATGGLLAAVVRTAPPDKRAFHIFGTSDAEGFAAMGIVETLVHVHDIAEGLGLPFTPPAGLCDRTLARLFPDAPTAPDRWSVLLWCTGRTALPGHPRRTSWRWDGTLREPAGR
ncbi:hypothetical protein [Streptomyces purpurogeneiscleroticus]|uniref:hypothetical protein n=1 Tax=Streptomyces purpurogeneiscleroticus TaxID=68259 RepID=UPI001CBE7950|nr:hypothetical protein [Streptomyces purpurogeneiscleroticus]MBZ4020038.1 hypothetical protein [Streptomyces purpurogeneiscleroticus]